VKRLAILIASIIIFPSLLWAVNDYYLPKPQRLAQVQAKLGGAELTLMLARTYPEKAKGLMFVQSLPENHGMLFVYSAPEYMSFWMKNTYIPLDLIFFDERLQITEWIRGMRPDDNRDEESLPKYSSAQKAMYALELNQGSVDKLKLKIGDKLEIPLACLYSD
jgi:uncharacterized membrane protein (UPF0127 family)